MNFKTALPEFYEEVRSLLIRLDRNDLASQLSGLEIVQRCPCSDFGCASFAVSAANTPDTFEVVPSVKRSTFTKSLNLNAERGKIKISMDQLSRITAFEILNRADVRRQLFKRR